MVTLIPTVTVGMSLFDALRHITKKDEHDYEINMTFQPLNKKQGCQMG
jgi:hypothetical protein